MSINKDNYERFLLDYLEGQLDANEVSEVLLFLEQHPDIKAEFEGLAEVSIPVFPDSESSFAHLKKPLFNEVKEQYQSLLIADLEGDIAPNEREMLTRGKELYPELFHEEQLFAQTFLAADPTIRYPFKQSLKKGGLWVVHRNVVVRVAAVLCVTMSIGWYFLGRQPHPQQSIAVAQSIGHTPKAPQKIVAPKLQQKDDLQLGRTTKAANNEENEEVVTEHPMIAFHSIEEISSRSVIASEPSSVEVELDRQSFAWLPTTQPQQTTPLEPYFPDLKLLAANEFAKGTQQLEDKAVTAFAAFNKAAGVTMEKDEVTGKVKKFEIAVLGFEWSQSK